jgi:mannose-6-phosphate isomerase-like protein (cupin superfamily)
VADLKSTLRVFNEVEIDGGGSKVGVDVKGIQSRKVLIGNEERATERLRIHLNIFRPGTKVPLHWHLIEAVYYVIRGRAVMEDIEGKSHEIGPGGVVYYPAGIAGAHSWEIKEEMELISVRATTEREKLIQFSVDKSTKESTIKFDDLLRCGGAQFKSLY